MSKGVDRRTLMTTAIATFGAAPALGQTDEGTNTPYCFNSIPFGDWSVSNSSLFFPPNAVRTSLITGTVERDFYSSVRGHDFDASFIWNEINREYGLGSNPDVEFYDRTDGFGMQLDFGRPKDEAVKESYNEALSTRGGIATLHADTTEIARYEDITSKTFSALVRQEALLEIAAATTTLTVRLYIGEVGRGNMVSRQRIAFAGLADALAARDAHQRAHLAEIEEAGRCLTPACAMTTAAVDMLGRDDDCFELTQMRRLRAAFPDYDWVIKDYLAASGQLLARPGWRLTACLMLFYVFFVWPTALLVAVGVRKPAGYLYLGGFWLLKRAMGLRPQGA